MTTKKKVKEDRIVINPTDDKTDIGIEMMEFLEDLEEVMEASKKINSPRYRFDPMAFYLWRIWNAHNRET